MRKKQVVAIAASTFALLVGTVGTALAHDSTAPGPHRGGGVEITDNSDNSVSDNDVIDLDRVISDNHILSDNEVRVLTAE